MKKISHPMSCLEHFCIVQHVCILQDSYLKICLDLIFTKQHDGDRKTVFLTNPQGKSKNHDEAKQSMTFFIFLKSFVMIANGHRNHDRNYVYVTFNGKINNNMLCTLYQIFIL